MRLAPPALWRVITLAGALLATAAAVAEPLILEVKEAVVAMDLRTSDPVLTITLSPASQEAFGRFTAANVGRKAALRIDGKVVMTPVIREPILGGRVQIMGRDLGDVRALASRLSAGNVTLEVDIVAD